MPGLGHNTWMNKLIGTISIFIPYLTKQINLLARTNHWTWTNEKNAVYAHVREALEEDPTLRPERPIEKADLILIRYSPTESDADGVVSGFKYVIDALVLEGVLLDDKISNVAIFPRYVKATGKKKRGVGIVIVPVA